MGFDDTDYRRRVLYRYRTVQFSQLQTAVREFKSDPTLRVPPSIDLTDLYDIAPGVSASEVQAQVAAVAGTFDDAAHNVRTAAAGRSLVELHRELVRRNTDFTTEEFWTQQWAQPRVTPPEPSRPLVAERAPSSDGLKTRAHDVVPALPDLAEKPDSAETPRPAESDRARQVDAAGRGDVAAGPRTLIRPLTLAVTATTDLAGRRLIEATWPAAPGLHVEVWHARRPAPWRFGERVDMSLVSGATRMDGREFRTDDARHGVQGVAPDGLRHYLVVTRDGMDAVIGECRPMALCPPPVDATVLRYHDEAVLSWTWPGPEFEVDVEWSSPAGSGHRRMTQSIYRAEGGCRLLCGSGALTARLTVVVETSSDSWRSQPHVVEHPGAVRAIGYRASWARNRLGRPVTCTLTFDITEPSMRVPIVVVGSKGNVLPPNVEYGVRLAETTLTGDPLLGAAVTVDVTCLGRRLWVRAFAADGAVVQLSDPPATTLRGS